MTEDDIMRGLCELEEIQRRIDNAVTAEREAELSGIAISEAGCYLEALGVEEARLLALLRPHMKPWKPGPPVRG